MRILDDGGFRPVDPDAVGTGSPTREAIAAGLGRDSPVWLDMTLQASPTKWVEPWTPASELPVAWEPVREVVDLLGVSPEEDTSESSRLAASVLEGLPHLNELGVLRGLSRELADHGVQAHLFPLIGFIPTCELDDPRRPDAESDPLEFVLIRVNAAALGQWFFTVRLPDRLCSGSRSDERNRRIAASDHFTCLPDLTVFPDLLPPGRAVEATDMADALALYLAATAACVPEFVRRRLFPIERALLSRLSQPSRPEDDALLDRYKDVFDLRITLQIAEEEFRRLLQRLSEVELDAVGPTSRIRRSYSSALEEIDALQQDLRLTGDGLGAKLEQKRQEDTADRHEQLQTLIATIGALLVLPALVATLFREQAKLPRPDSAVGLAAMLLLMTGVAILGWQLLDRLVAGELLGQKLRVGRPDTSRRTRALWVGVFAFMLGLLAVALNPRL